MRSPIAPWFEDYNEEALHVGALLTGYGELEFEAYACAAEAMGNSDLTFRLLFRLRSESQRIDAFDTMLMPTVSKFELEGPYAHIIGALRHCRSIRNVYAHSHWHFPVEGNRLYHCSLEDAAKKGSEAHMIKMNPVFLPLLKQQVLYFEYCMNGLQWLRHEMIRLDGGPKHSYTAPKGLPKPSLGSHLD